MDSTTKYTIIGLSALALISIIWWVYNKLNLDDINCKNLGSFYDKFPMIHTININNDQYQYNLRDYYIKTAYNCCASGDLKNNYVNVCALKTCIKQGVRCLDFEIYSVDNEPVIACSSLNSYYTKETYNVVLFSDAMNIVNNYAFSSSACPNSGDPLILHLRIMSNNKPIYDKMAEIILNTLSMRLMGKEYSYENNGLNFGITPLKDLMGKVIICVDKTNPLFVDTLLDEYVNMASNAAFMRSMRFQDVKLTPDMQELIEFNKKQMSIVLPDYSASSANPSSVLSLNYGAQLVALSFQNFDSSLEFYNEMFESNGCAFVLKPEVLRYIVVTIPEPPPANPAYSYEARSVTSDYYNFTI
jgi:hypothetical protein